MRRTRRLPGDDAEWDAGGDERGPPEQCLGAGADEGEDREHRSTEARYNETDPAGEPTIEQESRGGGEGEQL